MQLAANERWTVMFHAHEPGVSVSRDALEHLFTLADEYGLDTVGFDELVPGPPRGALAFAFDDNATDAWMSAMDIVEAHHARITFFVCRWPTITDHDRANVHALFDKGHDIESHTVNHIHADEYVAANGLQAYLDDEVLPEKAALDAEGFHTTSFAYPFGIHSAAMDDAILEHVDRVRTTPGPCPY